MAELSFAPAYGGMDAGKEADQEACLLDKGAFGKHGQEVVHIQPGLVRELR